MAPSSATTATPNHTTTILLSNIHCPSCVRTIEDTLGHYRDQISDVSTSTVSQTVTIRHMKELSAATLATALYDAGFDVQSMWEQQGNQRISTLATSLFDQPGGSHTASNKATHAFLEFSCGLIQSPDQRRLHDERHTAYCGSCAADESGGREDSLARLTASISTNEPFSDKDITVVTTQPTLQPSFKVVLGIHGMTCSACVGRVAEVLEAKAYVKEVNINLISQSATLYITDQIKASELVEEVEDIGYDATLESCEPVIDTAQSGNEPVSSERTITIKVDGLHCQHCPSKITEKVRNCYPDINIVTSPQMDGLMTIAYTPRSPQLTIRSILKCIQEADPAFTASVFQPPSLEDRARTLQTRHWRRIAIRLGISACMAVPTFAFGVVIMSLLPASSTTRQHWMQPSLGQLPLVQWPLLIFASIVYCFAADIFHRRALKEVYMMWRRSSKIPILKRLYRFGSMDMLLSLGTTVAYAGSIVILIISATQSKDLLETDSLNTTTYFDAVVFLTMFLLMGRLLEAYGKAQTADAVASLGKLRPAEALLMCSADQKNGDSTASITQSIPIVQLEVDDVVVVPAGGSPPCDGIIHRGRTTMDESSLTGESNAIARAEGDVVFAGTVNITNSIQVRVTGITGASLLDRIIDTVREGQARRAPIERVADVLTGYFVPVIIAFALLDWIVWLALGRAGRVPYVTVGTGGWTFWSLQFAIAVLVVACPCGIGLAAPTALFVGTGLAAKQGILVKGGGEAFQEASTLDCVVFDKTGTITEGGNPQITDSRFFTKDCDQSVVLGALHTLESTSSHPLAKAVVTFCTQQRSTKLMEMQTTQELPGKGMVGKVCENGTEIEVFIGNERLATELRVFLSAEAVQLFRAWSSEGKTVMLVGSRRSHSASYTLDLMLAASDVIRPEAPTVVKALHDRGIEVWLLSGDNATTAKVVAGKVGIPADHVIAEVLPHQKAEKIQYLQRSARKLRRKWFSKRQAVSSERASVAMVGDGINDAPALAVADVGIAMGSGSDTAISTASFVLLSSDLTAVLTLLRLSRAVLRRVRFNFGWALGYNLIMLPIAAGVLYPVVSNGSHIRLDPVWASLAMALSSVSVVTSSLLLKTKLPILGFHR